MRYLIFFTLLILGLWVAGIRVHPEVLKDYLEAYTRRDYRKLDLKSGRSLIGEYLGENADSIRLKVGGGFVTFRLSEIEKMTQITTSEIKTAIERGEIPDFPKKSFLTRRPEDSLLPKVQIKIPPVLSSQTPASTTPSSASAPGLPFDASPALEMAQKYKSLAEARRMEIEENVRQMEEGDSSSQPQSSR